MAFVMRVAIEIDWTSIIRPILRTFRGYRSSSNPFETWIRDDAGPVNLDGAELRVRVYAYDRSHHVAEVAGQGSAEGRVNFTVPRAAADSLAPGPYRLELLMGLGDDSQTIQVGLLELI
ncbi:hypothetical protein [Lysobacter sp. Hz 25]|uniref:hypothetical protein n=1 Tax=Lysobacter sp. Hz 25 TaxID=3383698 RepID=UPI0038D4639F